MIHLFIKTPTNVADEEVQAEIQSRLQAATTTKEITKGTAKEGDSVKIVYVGKLKGKAFEGGSTGDSGTTITLGSSGYIDGFDDGVIGMKVGERKDLNLRFPDDYNKLELRGQDVVFEVTLKAIVKNVTPEYNLDFVKENGNFKSLDAYEDSIRQELLDKKEKIATDDLKNQIWQQVVSNAQFKELPKEKVQKAKKDFTDYYHEYANSSGMDFSEFLAMYMGMTEEDFDKYSTQYSEEVVKQELTMFAIAKKERVGITESDYKKKLKTYMDEQGISDEMFQTTYGKSFEEYAGKDNLVKTFTLEKVLDTLLQYSKISTAE